MEASRIRKGMVVECQQGVGTILVVDHEAETVLLSKQGTEQQLAVSFDEIEDDPQLHGGSDRYYQRLGRRHQVSNVKKEEYALPFCYKSCVMGSY